MNVEGKNDRKCFKQGGKWRAVWCVCVKASSAAGYEGKWEAIDRTCIRTKWYGAPLMESVIERKCEWQRNRLLEIVL